MISFLRKFGLIAAISASVSFISTLTVDYFKNFNQITNDRIQKFEESYIELAQDIALINFLGKIPPEKSDELRDDIVKKISSSNFLANDLKSFSCKSDLATINKFLDSLTRYRDSLYDVFSKRDATLSKDAAFELTTQRHYLIQSTLKYKRWPFYLCWIPIVDN